MDNGSPVYAVPERDGTQLARDLWLHDFTDEMVQEVRDMVERMRKSNRFR